MVTPTSHINILHKPLPDISSLLLYYHAWGVNSVLLTDHGLQQETEAALFEKRDGL